MTQLLKRANQKGWPVHQWCWRESVGTEEHPGWLSMEAITRKKHEVSEDMWNTEYDLQEPSHAGRAINTEAVEAMFDPELGMYEGDLDERLILSCRSLRALTSPVLTGPRSLTGRSCRPGAPM